MSTEFSSEGWHLGRSFTGTRLEDGCPCVKAPCGLVDANGISDECDQHPFQWARTIRQSHTDENCPTRTVHPASAADTHTTGAGA